MPEVEQSTHQVGTHETRGACDKDTHVDNASRRRARKVVIRRRTWG